MGKHRFTLCWAIGLQVFLALPYLLAPSLAPAHYRFGGFIYNPDDPYVYLSWMRQAADGHLLFRNLFTLEPQRGVSFHVFFLLLGWLSAAIHAPLILVYHGARVLFGMIFVFQVAALGRLLGLSMQRQAWMTALVTTGSGLGWIYFLAASPILDRQDTTYLPTDLWMTETIPFLTLLLSPLFTCALTLLLGSFLLMLRAEKESCARWASGAGVCVLLLGNIHSYDILLFHGVWVVYLVILWMCRSSLRDKWPLWRPGGALQRYFLMIMISCPSALYQLWALHVEAVFEARANVPTPSPSVGYYLLGTGLLLPIAVVGVTKAIRDGLWLRPMDLAGLPTQPNSTPGNGPIILWLCAWAVAGLALPYAPFTFQRKLAFGLDLPYLTLAALFLGLWVDRSDGRFRSQRRAVVLVMATLLALSNVCFLRSVIQLLAQNQSNVEPMAPLYISQADQDAMRWLRSHRQPGDIVLSMPRMGNIIPSATGDSVYVGHWGETANWSGHSPPGKLQIAMAFYDGALAPPRMLELLKTNRIKFVYWGAAEREDLPSNRTAVDPAALLPSLRPVYMGPKGKEQVKIYQLQ